MSNGSSAAASGDQVSHTASAGGASHVPNIPRPPASLGRHKSDEKPLIDFGEGPEDSASSSQPPKSNAWPIIKHVLFIFMVLKKS
jgi:hypothetical protein